MTLDRNALTAPFYANIFSYIPSAERDGYAEMDEATLLEVQDNPGFLGYEVTGTDTHRIFISYWKDMAAINLWRENATHKRAKSFGKKWYAAYHSMLVKIESHSHWNPELL